MKPLTPEQEQAALADMLGNRFKVDKVLCLTWMKSNKLEHLHQIIDRIGMFDEHLDLFLSDIYNLTKV